MCIAVFSWRVHQQYPFLLFLNRDEFHSRPTKPLSWWDGDEILGGRDDLAGGTWLACSRDGKVAFLTNVRELHSLSQIKSRGDLVVRFLESKKSPMEFAEEILKEADHYNGFNLILADLCSLSMVYVTNRPKEKVSVTKVSPGIHVLSNASLDSPWPKAQRLENNFKGLLHTYNEVEFPIEEMAEKLMRDTVKDEDKMLPGIYPPETEYFLSSIFVEQETTKGRYGTRSISALYAKSNGEVSFYETHVEGDLWKEETLNYQIERIK